MLEACWVKNVMPPLKSSDLRETWRNPPDAIEMSWASWRWGWEGAVRIRGVQGARPLSVWPGSLTQPTPPTMVIVHCPCSFLWAQLFLKLPHNHTGLACRCQERSTTSLLSFSAWRWWCDHSSSTATSQLYCLLLTPPGLLQMSWASWPLDLGLTQYSVAIGYGASSGFGWVTHPTSIWPHCVFVLSMVAACWDKTLWRIWKYRLWSSFLWRWPFTFSISCSLPTPQPSLQ